MQAVTHHSVFWSVGSIKRHGTGVLVRQTDLWAVCPFYLSAWTALCNHKQAAVCLCLSKYWKCQMCLSFPLIHNRHWVLVIENARERRGGKKRKLPWNYDGTDYMEKHISLLVRECIIWRVTIWLCTLLTKLCQTELDCKWPFTFIHKIVLDGEGKMQLIFLW